MKMINGARILLETLKYLGVTDIFGYPGGAVIPIYDALYDFNGITHYMARHEQGAVHSADGYARTKKIPGVCLATSGPGATNLVTGIMTAYMDSVPLLAITGQVHAVALGKDSFQESDIIGITSPITKNNYLVRSIFELPKIIKEAYFLSKHGRPGPVLIDIPKNIQEESISFEIFTSLLNDDLDEIKKYRNSFSSKDLEEFKNLLTLSKKPVLVVGGGVLTSNATEIVKKFVKDFNLPVVSTLMGIGIFNSSYENYFGMIGMHGLKEANRLVDDCDLLISFGMRFDDRIVGDKKNFSPNSKKIHIDIDRAEVNKNILVDLPIISDIKTFLENFYQLDFYKTFDSWFLNNKNKKIENKIQTNNKILNQISVLEKLNEFIDENYIVVTDVGQHQMFTAQHLDIKVPYHFCTSGGAGTMGYGLPAAIGAQIANPNKKVIAIVGDGGFQMNQQELILLTQYNLPIKVLILNNNALGMVKQWQELFYNNRLSSVIMDLNPSFVDLAKANYVKGIKINSYNELDELENLIKNDEPILIDIVVSDENNVFPIIPAGKSFKDTLTEDGR